MLSVYDCCCYSRISLQCRIAVNAPQCPGQLADVRGWPAGARGSVTPRLIQPFEYLVTLSAANRGVLWPSPLHTKHTKLERWWWWGGRILRFPANMLPSNVCSMWPIGFCDTDPVHCSVFIHLRRDSLSQGIETVDHKLSCPDTKKKFQKINTWCKQIHKLESEILGSSGANFSKFVLCTQKYFLVFCYLPMCIDSLMDA